MKRIIIACIFIFIILFSLFYPTTSITASKNAMLIWSEQILPTLLPFSILSSILLHSNLFGSSSKNKHLLSIITVLLCGFTFGFPIGSKLASDFYKKEMLTRKQAHILAITANNFSPMYVCGFVLPFLFPNEDVTILTYVILYFVPLLLCTFLLLFTFHESNDLSHKNTASRFQLDMQIIDAGIVSSFETLIKLCGYIVMFSLLSAILQMLFQEPHIATRLLIGNMEITNGSTLFSKYNIDIRLKYICTIQLLSLGGLSGLAQTASILQGSGLSIKTYICGKCLLSIISVLLSVYFIL